MQHVDGLDGDPVEDLFRDDYPADSFSQEIDLLFSNMNLSPGRNSFSEPQMKHISDSDGVHALNSDWEAPIPPEYEEKQTAETAAKHYAKIRATAMNTKNKNASSVSLKNAPSVPLKNKIVSSTPLKGNTVSAPQIIDQFNKSNSSNKTESPKRSTVSSHKVRRIVRKWTVGKKRLHKLRSDRQIGDQDEVRGGCQLDSSDDEEELERSDEEELGEVDPHILTPKKMSKSVTSVGSKKTDSTTKQVTSAIDTRKKQSKNSNGFEFDFLNLTYVLFYRHMKLMQQN